MKKATARRVAVPPSMRVVHFSRLERAFRTEIFYYFDPVRLPGATTQERAKAAAQWAEEKLREVHDGLATPGP
jgi:hypothetical protein